MNKWRKSFLIIWILFGFSIVGSTAYGYFLLQKPDNRSQSLRSPIQQEEQVEKKQESKNAKASFNPLLIQPVHAEEFAEAQLHYEDIVNQWGIGAVYIPSSSIQTKILAGMSNENLMVGVGTYRAEQRLGKGNYVLLAHNLVQGGGSLKNLRQTSEGSLIYATDFANIYEYRVIKNQVVNQSEGEILDESKAEETPLITFIRCEGGLNTTQRAVVQGTFVSSYPASEADNELKEKLGLVSVVQDQKQVDNIIVSNSMDTVSNHDITSDEHTNQSVKKSKEMNALKEEKEVYSSFEKYCIWLVKECNDIYVLITASVVYLLVLFGTFQWKIRVE
ncbi:class A sortase [Enterococcus faecium]|uniref:class A sortase n=1 Tax=Enterococcus faecium TaxID=1352 RepID=UPI000CF2105F|nr:class A sortase [Enterococcus faecium]EME8134985.1 class A sortase [Enterococcus faecium]MDQ8428170.1 class A sortase [Enterococcus faecium]PQE68896.1 class A sortase [Enterococcus faecium]